jgi:pimeloyl-ACP methyl ester carboxylesterase
MKSQTIDLDGALHYADHGGDGPTLVCVHGLGGSHVNWSAVAPTLAERARVLAPDLAGHGYTPLTGRTATLGANTRLLGRFLDAVADGPVILVGNSMGGLIAMLQTAANPASVAGLVLVNPSLPRAPGARFDPEITRSFAAYALPGVGMRFLRERRARLGARGAVAETLRYCCADPSRVPLDAIETAVAFAEERFQMPWADDAFLQAARSILAIHAGRRSRELVRRLPPVPTLLMHGVKDRLVPFASARLAARQRPDWTFEVLEDVGHVPQLEVPELFVDLIWNWRGGAGAQAFDAQVAQRF